MSQQQQLEDDIYAERDQYLEMQRKTTLALGAALAILTAVSIFVR